MKASDEIPENIPSAPHTSVGMRIICILSWMRNLTLLILALGLMVGGHDFVRWADYPLLDALVRDDSNGTMFYLTIKVFLTISSCFAVWQMWKLKNSGFWIFLSAEFMLLLIPLVFLNVLGWPYLIIKLLISLIFTLFFVFFFIHYYKLLK